MSTASSSDSTVIAGSAAMLASAASAHSDEPCCKVAMCQGSGPHMSKETQSLLRSRLRMAALLLALGFGVFFARELFLVDYNKAPQVFLLIFHGLVTLALVAVGGRLCQKCSYATSTLRIAEIVIFGLPALYFLTLQWEALQAKVPMLTGITAPWLMLVLV